MTRGSSHSRRRERTPTEVQRLYFSDDGCVAADPNREGKRQRIDDAFFSAAHAQFPYRRRFAGPTDARSAQRYWNDDLEALTLQTRAVDAMLAIDPNVLSPCIWTSQLQRGR